jgi:TRAP transporter TAXI family solute receptor
MRRTRIGYVAMVMLAALISATSLIVACAPVAGPAPVKLGRACTYSTSSMYVGEVAECKAISKIYPEFTITPIEVGPGQTAVEAIAKGEADYGLGGLDVFYRAYHALDEFKDTTWGKDMRFLWTNYIVPLNHFVTQASGVTSIQQLEGKRYGIIQGTTATLFSWFLESNGIEIQETVASTDQLVAAVNNRSIIGFSKLGIKDAAILQVQATTPMTFLALTEEMVDKAREDHPAGVFPPIILPANTYEGQTEDIFTFGVVAGAMTTNRLAEDVVYRMAEAVYQEREALAASHTTVAAYATWPEDTIRFFGQAGLPLHAGVVKLLRDKGYEVPESVLPPEMK